MLEHGNVVGSEQAEILSREYTSSGVGGQGGTMLKTFARWRVASGFLRKNE